MRTDVFLRQHGRIHIDEMLIAYQWQNDLLLQVRRELPDNLVILCSFLFLLRLQGKELSRRLRHAGVFIPFVHFRRTDGHSARIDVNGVKHMLEGFFVIMVRLERTIQFLCVVGIQQEKVFAFLLAHKLRQIHAPLDLLFI